jgi:15-cis-phytoene synthase
MTAPMIAPADLAACEAAIRTGSYSFHAASRLMPARVRPAALALYAFCRCADDAVDDHDDKISAVLRLRDRLDLCYRGRPRDLPADRAFADMIAAVEMPRALPEALLEGFVWDAEGRHYDSLADVHGYSARVAAVVGAMMCVIMGVREADALARACDLGLAMQLTNIARDVGEDARAGRLYLPRDWFADAGLRPEGFLADPAATPAVRRMVKRLLAEADRLYFRAEAGLGRLPLDCRAGIWTARLAYAAIGGDIARHGHDSITRRARTGRLGKIGSMTHAIARTGWALVMPAPVELHARPEPATAFLVEAAARDRPARETWAEGRAAALMDALAMLENRDRQRRAGLMRERRQPISP